MNNFGTFGEMAAKLLWVLVMLHKCKIIKLRTTDIQFGFMINKYKLFVDFRHLVYNNPITYKSSI
jgi:hypothetical protein